MQEDRPILVTCSNPSDDIRLKLSEMLSNLSDSRLVIIDDPQKLEISVPFDAFSYPDEYMPKKKEQPKPLGFDHTKFSRRKRR